MAKRRRFTAGFEARVALEALREDEAVQSIGTRHQLRPDQVSRWERKAREGLVDVFEEGPAGRRHAHERKLRSQPANIGQLVVDRDLLQTAAR